LNFKYIALDNPNIKLVRSTSDSTWNYERIAKPSKPKTEEKEIPSEEPSKFALNIKYFEIKGLKLIYSDSISNAVQQEHFNKCKYTKSEFSSFSIY
jgi:uncharacterized protein involved in outer membrane biogenesis